jgi:hypothetical protein
VHHASCPRFLAAVAAAILIAVCPRQASGQTRCSVQQELFFSWVTGRFTVGTVTASLTLPQFIIAADSPMVVLIELSAPPTEQPEEKLMIRSGYETVELRDGAAMWHTARASG